MNQPELPARFDPEALPAAPRADSALQPPTGLDWNNAGFALAPVVEPTQLVGYQNQPQVVVATPKPLEVPRRRRWVVASLIVAVLATGLHWIWASTLQHVALGVVSGETITVCTEAEGLVEEVPVNDGDHVTRGQLLLSLENQTWRNELARLKDELQVVSAETAAEEAQLQWQQDVAQDGRPRALSDYHEALGRLQNEEAALESLQLTFDRLARLQDKRAASADEYDRTRLALKGQAAKVEELRNAVKELEVRVDRATALVGQSDARLSPKRARAEFLRGEIARSEKKITDLHIRAPVDGVVLKRFHSAGEWVGKAESLFSILKDGSQEVLVYVQQDDARGFERLGVISLYEESRGESLKGRIVRVDPQLHRAPQSISTFYRRGEPLVVVHVAADPTGPAWPILPMDGVVRLPLTETIAAQWSFP
ncbi:MAG: HlyD family secretion protein [Planctomycetaceae bacterium]